MKITAFNGSHFRGKSNTQLMINEFLGGAAEAGAKAESVALISYNIQQCTNCMDCFIEGRCPIKDDMAILIQKFVDSEIVVFATPLYMDMVTGLMKTFMDRLLPLLDPHFEQDETGEYRHFQRDEKYPDFVVIANGHMPEQSQFQAIKLFMSRFARTMHSHIIGEIYRASGGILNSEEESFQQVIKDYRQFLRQAGREIASEGRISENTAAQLNKELVPVDEYIAYANKMWDRLLQPEID